MRNLPDRTFPDRPSTKKPIAHPQKTRSPIHKKPDRGAPETGFLPQYLVTTDSFGQKPGFLDYRPPLTPSNRRKCTRPNTSPATTLTPSGAIAQHLNSASPLKLATSLPLSKSHILRVLSREAEIAVRPSGARSTAYTQLV